MSYSCRNTILMMLLTTPVACGGGSTSQTSPSDPFASIAVGTLPVGTLGGTNVLLLTAGGLVTGDSGQLLPEVEANRTALLVAANAALDSAVRRDAREVNWMGLDEQRRAARRNPTLNLEPDRFGTAYVIGAHTERIPDPLFGQLRSLAAVTSARYAVVPAGVRIGGTPDALVASFVLVVADARTGQVLLRFRATGRAAPTAAAALANAASSVIASPLH